MNKFALTALCLFASTCALAQLPEAPQPVADRSFWALTAFDAVATAGDGVTSLAFTRNCPYEVNAPELYGRKPSAARETLVMGGLFAASVAVSYELKKHNVHIWKFKLWALPLSYEAVGHAYGMVHNIDNCS